MKPLTANRGLPFVVRSPNLDLKVSILYEQKGNLIRSFSLLGHLPLPAQLFLVKASVLAQPFFDYIALGFPVKQENKINKVEVEQITNNLDKKQISKKENERESQITNPRTGNNFLFCTSGIVK